jgi:ribosomal protein S18 acetylase RimI-like enzyme
MEIRPFQPGEEGDVITLWDRCGLLRSWNDPEEDIARKLRVQPELFLVGMIGSRLVATVMAGYEGHRGWVNYLAVAPEVRREGYGRKMMHEAERRLRDIGCPKVSLQIRRVNGDVTAFYERLGYKEDEVISMGKRLEHDEGA